MYQQKYSIRVVFMNYSQVTTRAEFPDTGP